MKLSGGSSAYLSVYAPRTSVELSGGAPVFGALLGKTLMISRRRGSALRRPDGHRLGALLHALIERGGGAGFRAGAPLAFGAAPNGKMTNDALGDRMTLLGVVAALAAAQSSTAAITVGTNAAAPALRVDAHGERRGLVDVRAAAGRRCSFRPAAAGAGRHARRGRRQPARCAAPTSRSSACSGPAPAAGTTRFRVAGRARRADRASLLALARRPDRGQPHREEGRPGSQAHRPCDAERRAGASWLRHARCTTRQELGAAGSREHRLGRVRSVASSRIPRTRTAQPRPRA